MGLEHKNIFNEVTSLHELNINTGGYKMPKNDDWNFSEDNAVKVSMEFWKFKEDKEAIGTFSRWEKDNYGEHAVIVTREGNEELHLPNLTALNGKLKSGQIDKGSKVKIVYDGPKKAKSGRLYEDFIIQIKH